MQGLTPPTPNPPTSECLRFLPGEGGPAVLVSPMALSIPPSAGSPAALLPPAPPLPLLLARPALARVSATLVVPSGMPPCATSSLPSKPCMSPALPSSFCRQPCQLFSGTSIFNLRRNGKAANERGLKKTKLGTPPHPHRLDYAGAALEATTGRWSGTKHSLPHPRLCPRFVHSRPPTYLPACAAATHDGPRWPLCSSRMGWTCAPPPSPECGSPAASPLGADMSVHANVSEGGAWGHAAGRHCCTQKAMPGAPCNTMQRHERPACPRVPLTPSEPAWHQTRGCPCWSSYCG